MQSIYRAAERRPNCFELMGIPVHPVGVGEVHAFMEDVIRKRAQALVLNVNIHCVNLALRHSWLKDFFKEAQLVFCDGDGVRWGLKILGFNPPPKITYDRWIWELADFCDKRRFSLFFLGGKPGVAEEAALRLQVKCPGLQIAGVHHGYFDQEGAEGKKVIEKINQLKPDILIVGFGMPLQEKWLFENWKGIRAHIFLTGGAVFDYASGRARRAPSWMIRLHGEWFYRFLQEPRRLFIRYFFGIPSFFFNVFLERLRRGVR